MVIESEGPELDISQKPEIIYKQSSETKQVSEQFKHGKQEIKEGISRHCTPESLSPPFRLFQVRRMWGSQQRLGIWHRSGTLVCHFQRSYI